MKTLKTLVLLLLLSLTGLSQTTGNSETEKPYIEITGTAEKQIIPDEIYIEITIRERHEGKEKITIQKQETDLKEALKSLEISLDDLSLLDANSNYIKVKWRKKDVITKTEYILKVKDAMTVGQVFKKLDNLHIVDANIDRVSHSKIIEFKKEVRIMAIKAAKEKADYLLNAIGEQTGKPLKVYESNSTYTDNGSHLNVRGSRSSNAIYKEYDNKTSTGKVALEFRKIKLQASIYVKFEIK